MIRHTLLFFLLVSNLVLAQEKGVIIVKMSGFSSSEGMATIQLHNIPEAYPTIPEKAFKTISVKITKRLAEAVFENIPYGKYAISVYHDEDGDGELDTNFIGIPSEDVAASNGAKGSFGPPSFQEAAFDVNSKMSIHKIKFND